MSDRPVHVENALRQPRGNYAEVLEKILAKGKCPFCEEQLFEHHTKPILFSTSEWIVTTNAWPYDGARLQFLLIPRVHVESIEQLSIQTWFEFFEAYKRIVVEYELPGATLLWRSGDGQFTGATVTHLHSNIFAGYPRSPDCKSITGLLGFFPPEPD
jgi:diadenosine tetraphosphate (Ap4A) HIT family hydrolase